MKSFNKKLVCGFAVLVLFVGQVLGLGGPCEDFYEYACANYSAENTDGSYGEITQKLDFELNKKLFHYFRNAFLYHTYGHKTQTYYDKVGIYLQSCLNEKQKSISQYLEELRPVVDMNWPLWDQHGPSLPNAQNIDLWSLLGQLQSFSWNNVIINWQIIRNKDNSLDVLLAPAVLEENGSLPQDFILALLLKILGVKETDAMVQQVKSTDLKWRDWTGGCSNYSTNLTEPSYAEFNVKDLNATFPQLRTFLKSLLQKEVDNVSTVAIENLEYFDFICRRNWSMQEKHELANYLMLRFVLYLALDSTVTFTPLECVKDLRKKFDLAVNYLSYKHLFIYKEAEKYEASLLNLADKIRLTMLHYFDKNFLSLSKESVEYLKGKLSAVKLNIGNLPDDFNFKAIQKFYQEIPFLDTSNYYKNHLLLLQHRFHNMLKYRQNQSHFIVTDNSLGGQSSPFYVTQSNMVVVPIASFHQSFFHYNDSLLKQVSLFGFVLAYEFTHALDLNSLNYDSQESITTNANFRKALSCLLQQEATEELNERLADLFAVRVAFKSYFECFDEENNCYERNGSNEGKEFFFNLAQFFCGKKNLKFMEHDTDKIRLNFIVKNFQPFAQLFHCAEKLPSNPKHKCRLY